jgi:o-succinylbenzoate synthase
MKIQSVEAFKVRVPMLGDYKMARGTHSALETIIVRLTTDDGIVGIGDSHQGVAGYTPETVDTMHAVITCTYAPAIVGRELESIEDLHRLLSEQRMGNQFARNAVEMALFDALARARNISVAELLGGPVRKKLALSASIGIADPEEVAEKAQSYVSGGYGTIKIKVGTPDVQLDIERVRAARNAIGDSVNIRIDANAGYSQADALTFMRGIGEFGIEHVEQPVAGVDIDGMVRLRKLGAAPIMADESVVSPQDAYRFISAGAVDAIKIKITKVGGYLNARRIIEICEAAGTTLVIGQGLCSSLEAAGEAQVACAFAHVTPVAEMVGPTKLGDDLATRPMDLSSGELVLPEGPGIGLELSEEKLKQYDVTGAPSAGMRAA